MIDRESPLHDYVAPGYKPPTDRWSEYRPRYEGRVIARPAVPGEIMTGPFDQRIECVGDEMLVMVGPLCMRVEQEVFDRMYVAVEEPEAKSP